MENTVPEKNPLQDAKIAYIVGVDKDNQLFFDIMGTQVELLQLMGLHEFAGEKIKGIKDERFMSGDRLTHEVGKAVAFTNDKVAELLRVNGEGYKMLAKLISELNAAINSTPPPSEPIPAAVPTEEESEEARGIVERASNVAAHIDDHA